MNLSGERGRTARGSFDDGSEVRNRLVGGFDQPSGYRWSSRAGVACIRHDLLGTPVFFWVCDVRGSRLFCPLLSSAGRVPVVRRCSDGQQLLDGEAVQNACERATDDQLAAIDYEYKLMAQRRGNALQRAKADLKFHMLIAESSHSLIVVSMSQLFYAQFFNAIYGSLYSVAGRDLTLSGEVSLAINAQHHAIYEALMVRDGEAAKTAAQAHIRYSMSVLEGRA